MSIFLATSSLSAAEFGVVFTIQHQRVESLWRPIEPIVLESTRTIAAYLPTQIPWMTCVPGTSESTPRLEIAITSNSGAVGVAWSLIHDGHTAFRDETVERSALEIQDSGWPARADAQSKILGWVKSSLRKIALADSVKQIPITSSGFWLKKPACIVLPLHWPPYNALRYSEFVAEVVAQSRSGEVVSATGQRMAEKYPEASPPYDALAIRPRKNTGELRVGNVYLLDYRTIPQPTDASAVRKSDVFRRTSQ